MSIIKVNCVDQTLVFENTPVIASGGLEENFVQFSFCGQWDGFIKTAVFWRSESEVFHNLLDAEDKCQVAPEVTASDGVIYFGVFGVNDAGRQRTTEVLTYRIVKGAITEGTAPSDPTPDIYTQLIGKYQEMLETSAETFKKEQAFETAMTQRQETFETNLLKKVDDDQNAFETAMTQDYNTHKQEVWAMAVSGLVPDGSITTERLKDGAVTTEKIAPGVLIDAYNKTQTLTDETRALFGLEAGTVPDGVFDFLGKYNIHWWSVLHGQAKRGYMESGKSFKSLPAGQFVQITRDYSYPQEILYSTSVSIDQETGEVSLDNPQTMTVKGASTPEAAAEHLKAIIALAAIDPVYITNLYGSPNTIYWVIKNRTYTEWFDAYSTETFGVVRYDGGYGLALNGSENCAEPVGIITSKAYAISAGETTYEHSTDRNAYPDSGTVDDLTYEYLGIPFQKFPTMSQIATGSYIGTGEAGEGIPNSLTFDFTPKLVVISDAQGEAMVMACREVTLGCHWHTSSSMYYCYCRREGNTVKWWNTAIMPVLGGQEGASAGGQKNTAGAAYYYIAIG